MMARRCALVFMALAVCCGGLACSDNNPKQRAAVGALQLQGAGATFPAPLYKKWLEEYQKQHADVQLSYKAVGSGEGTKQFMAGVVDFGASDAAMSDEEMAAVARGVGTTASDSGWQYCPGLQSGRIGRRSEAHTGRVCGHLSRQDQNLG